MEQNKYVLAMYDIRGKQEFIYRSNKIKAIMGGSAVIRDLFRDYLYPEAQKVPTPNKGIFNDPAVDFTPEGFRAHLEQGYIGEVVYEGGGNFLLLFKDLETYKAVTYAFTKRVLETVGTLRVEGRYIEGVNFEDYHSDRKALYAKRKLDPGIVPWASLPIVQVDTRTSQPLSDHRKNEKNEKEKLSKEDKAKYNKYEELIQNDDHFRNRENIPVLDEMVEKKGEDSLLAVVYIDGNNMGAQVQSIIKDTRSYQGAVKKLREFSNRIQKKYIDNHIKEIDDKIGKRQTNGPSGPWQDENNKGKRLILGAGDEITFICNAHDAYELAVTYLKSLDKDPEQTCTSCAGIAVFHSHAPFSDAYRIAEECCENAKKKMKELKLKDACLLDFHYCQSAIGTSLEDIRKEDEIEENSKPWLIWPENIKNITSIKEIEAMREYLNCLGRSNVKGLAESAKKSLAALKLDLQRIKAHMSEDALKKLRSITLIENMDEERRRKLIFDMVTVYDLWFVDEKEEAEND